MRVPESRCTETHLSTEKISRCPAVRRMKDEVEYSERELAEVKRPVFKMVHGTDEVEYYECEFVEVRGFFGWVQARISSVLGEPDKVAAYRQDASTGRYDELFTKLTKSQDGDKVRKLNAVMELPNVPKQTSSNSVSSIASDDFDVETVGLNLNSVTEERPIVKAQSATHEVFDIGTDDEDNSKTEAESEAGRVHGENYCSQFSEKS